MEEISYCKVTNTVWIRNGSSHQILASSYLLLELTLKENAMKNINANDFLAYHEIQQSAETNMLDINKVIELSGGYLDRETIMEIIKNYESLIKEYKHKIWKSYQKK